AQCCWAMGALKTRSTQRWSCKGAGLGGPHPAPQLFGGWFALGGPLLDCGGDPRGVVDRDRSRHNDLPPRASIGGHAPRTLAHEDASRVRRLRAPHPRFLSVVPPPSFSAQAARFLISGCKWLGMPVSRWRPGAPGAAATTTPDA